MTVSERELVLYQNLLNKLIYSENYFSQEEKEALLNLIQGKIEALKETIEYCQYWNERIEIEIQRRNLYETDADHR